MARFASFEAHRRHACTASGVALLLFFAAIEVEAAPGPRATSGGTASVAGAAVRPLPRRTPRALTFVPGRVLVLADERAPLREGVVAAPQEGGDRLAETMGTLGVQSVRSLGPVGRKPATRALRVYALESARPDFDPRAAAATLRATGAFRAVSPDYRFAIFNTLPDDLYLPYQWYVDDGGVADIRLPAAWDVERGDTSVVIAILDTGVDTSHPDLAGQIWHNPGEIPGNGIDDDGDGLVDDVKGWDFGQGDNDPNPEYTADPSGIDVGFHGTFCAGLAAAATDNGDGIAGAGWRCRIMPLKVSHPVDGITFSAVASAFVYAADHGASVISMSFGGPGDPGVPEFFQALVDMATAAGVVCVAAAGNDGLDTPVYPAACDKVLAVAATDDGNARADFSNYGSWVDVAAPGSFMWSTTSQNYPLTFLDELIYILFFGWDGESPYMYGDGTSFSCPLAAGVCGLIRSRFPSLTPAQVVQHLIATGDAVAYDQPVGPRVNAYQAVSLGPVAVEPSHRSWALELAGGSPNPFSGSSTIAFSLATEGAAALSVFDCRGRLVRTLARGALDAGPHLARWDGRDEQGRQLASGVYFVRLESGAQARQRKLVLLGR